MELQINELYKLFLDIGQVSTDSRKLKPGEIFWALRGENFNGNTFAQKALEMGAAFSVVDNPDLRYQDGMIYVNDSLKALQEIASIHRQNFSVPVIAITGSNGKTTTKELIRTILETGYSVLATQGNLNNHIGVPLTILKLKDDTDIAIIEMGANHPGEISLLCEIADPNAGIITNIGKAHLGGFGGFDGVVKAKGELYNYIRKIGAHVFVNSDDDLLMEMSSGISRFTYGTSQTSMVSGKLRSEYPGLKGDLVIKGERYHFSSPLYGGYNFMNILCSTAVGTYFRAPNPQILRAVEKYQPDNLRSQTIDTGTNKVYMDAYNANPTSMGLALDFFRMVPEDNKLLILGDMLELGAESEKEHLKIINKVREAGFEKVILIGPEFRKVSGAAGIIGFRDYIEAGKYLRTHRPVGNTILIKASRGLELEKLLEFL